MVRLSELSDKRPIGTCSAAEPSMKAVISVPTSAGVRPISAAKIGVNDQNGPLAAPISKAPMKPTGDMRNSQPKRKLGLAGRCGGSVGARISGKVAQATMAAATANSARPFGLPSRNTWLPAAQPIYCTTL